MEVDEKDPPNEEEVKLIDTEVDKKSVEVPEPKSDMLDLIRRYIESKDQKNF